jgi:hypothetical protein
MSLAAKYAAIGQRATAIFEEDVAVNLRTGEYFHAKLQEREDIILTEETGVDPRTSHYLQVRREFNVDIQAQDHVEIKGRMILILPSVSADDPIKPHLKYAAQVLTPLDT